MKKISKFKPLLYTAGVFFFFILLVQLTLSHPEGNIFSSLWLLIVSVFQLISLVVGLAIGIVICMAVFLLIFAAAGFIYDRTRGREFANKSYQAAREQVVTALLALAPGKFGHLSPVPAGGYGSSDAVKRSYEPVNAPISVSLQTLPAASASEVPASAPTKQELLFENLRQIEQRLAGIERTIQAIESEKVQFVHAEQLDKVRTEVEDADGRAETAVEAKIAPMQNQLEQIAKQGEELSASTKKLGDIVLRIVTLEQKTAQIAELPQQVTELRDDLNAKYEALPQQLTDLRGELQQQIEAIQQKAKPKSRARKKTTTTQQS